MAFYCSFCTGVYFYCHWPEAKEAAKEEAGAEEKVKEELEIDTGAGAEVKDKAKLCQEFNSLQLRQQDSVQTAKSCEKQDG